MPRNKDLVSDPAGDWSHGLRDLSAAGPDGLATATEAEAPALIFQKQSHRFDHIGQRRKSQRQLRPTTDEGRRCHLWWA